MRILLRMLLALVLASLLYEAAYAQGTATAPLSGVVVDADGGVIPGATVVVKNDATGTSFNTVTNSQGVSVRALDTGTYTVTVSLDGFKTAVVNDMRVVLGTPANIKAVLEVGSTSETITVTGAASEIVNTQTATITATLNVDQINKMPLPTRNAINAVTFLVGVNTATTNRNSNINGLPDSFVNITMDGVSNNDNFLNLDFLAVLQSRGTVPAMDVAAYARAVERG